MRRQGGAHAVAIVVVAGDDEVRHVQRGHDLAEASVLRRAPKIRDVAGDDGILGLQREGIDGVDRIGKIAGSVDSEVRRAFAHDMRVG